MTDFSTGVLDDSMNFVTLPATQTKTLLGQNICPGGSVYFRILPLGNTSKKTENKHTKPFLHRVFDTAFKTVVDH